MKRTTLTALFLALLAAWTASGNATVETPRPGEAVYLLVLGERRTEPDVAVLGGRVLRSWADRRLVAMPPARLGDLQRQHGVAYVQRVSSGQSFDGVPVPAPASARVQAEAGAIVTSAAPAAWSTGIYTYDRSGNIKTMGTDHFGYDSVARIASANVHGQTQSYAYDPYGNLLALGAETIDVDAATNRPAAPQYGYDVMGNMKKDPGARNYHYDALGMVTAIDLPVPSAVPDSRMIYSVDDERIMVSEGSTDRFRLRGLDARVLREWKSIEGGSLEWERDYIYAGGSVIAGEVQVDLTRNGMRHYHTDHLSSTRMVTDGAGELVARHDYLPFGAEMQPTTTEYDNTGKAPRDPLKFTGHERDYFTPADTNGDSIDYMHARYYTPKWGRFLTVDPVVNVKASLPQPQFWNRYTYGGNNPMKLVDKDGRWASIFFTAHQDVIDTTLPFVDEERRSILRDAQVRVDLDQTNQYKHALSLPGQNVDDARAQAQQFVDKSMEAAIGHELKGNRQMAMEHLGAAIHTLQDATSPSHVGFQVYDPAWSESSPQVRAHVMAEIHVPGNSFGSGPSPHDVTFAAWTYFATRVGMPVPITPLSNTVRDPSSHSLIEVP
jgi:RHS repeat-associated protein